MNTPWHVIREHLENTLVLTEGVGRRAQARICADCHAKTIAGWDADVCALLAIVDPTPLDGVGEALAQLQGRRTYALTPEGGRLVLDHRTAGRISHRSPNAGRYDVLPEHACGMPPLPEVPSFIAVRPTREVTDAPF